MMFDQIMVSQSLIQKDLSSFAWESLFYNKSFNTNIWPSNTQTIPPEIGFM
jgi:hypothetical protein